ncbi:MAG: hypothetical protein EZS28_044959, partial [Streblomastix strix]
NLLKLFDVFEKDRLLIERGGRQSVNTIPGGNADKSILESGHVAAF